MADSNNTQISLSVTRRALHSSTTAGHAPLSFQVDAATTEPRTQFTSFDPALTLWYKWRAAYFQTAALRQKQQSLETRLADAIGFPDAGTPFPNGSIPVSRRRAFDNGVDEREPVVNVAIHQARWDQADREVGYSAARQEELAAADREQDLVDALMAAPATTLAGIAGKLDAILQEGECAEECPEFPWPQIRSALVDLVRMGQVLEPGSFIPGSDRKMPCRLDEGTRTDRDHEISGNPRSYRGLGRVRLATSENS